MLLQRPVPRRRKVKCDEEEPECKRCTSDGKKCDGYKLAITWVPLNQVSRHPPVDRRPDGFCPLLSLGNGSGNQQHSGSRPLTSPPLIAPSRDTANAIGAENPARHESLNLEYKPDMTRGNGLDDLLVGQSVVPSSLRYGNYAEMSMPRGQQEYLVPRGGLW